MTKRGGVFPKKKRKKMNVFLSGIMVRIETMRFNYIQVI